MGMTAHGVYMILNIRTDARYVGRTNDSFSRRWQRHKSGLRNNRHESRALQLAWNDDGPSSFVFVILESLPSGERADSSRERFWCEHFRSLGVPLYNEILNGYSPSPEARERISKAHLGKKNPKAGEANAKDWPDLTSPDGSVHSGIHNLLAFCVAQGLGASAVSPMRKVAIGMVPSYKGWTAPEARSAYLAEHPFLSPSPVTLVCEGCGREFVVRRSSANRRRFCSRECRAQHDSLIYAGNGNPNYRHGRRTRQSP
jgi:hypothetical protein